MDTTLMTIKLQYIRFPVTNLLLCHSHGVLLIKYFFKYLQRIHYKGNRLTDIKTKSVVTSREKRVGRGKTGARDQETQTTVYKTNKPQGHIAQHRKYGQYFMITLNGVQPLKIVNHHIVQL